MAEQITCDVCKAIGIDIVLLNGENPRLETAKLYRVYKDGPVMIKLCRFHAIQLFILGERQFLMQNRAFMRALSERKSEFTVLDD